MIHHRYLSSLPVILVILVGLLYVFNPISSNNQNDITYTPTDENFANPERGFYNWSSTEPGGSTLNADNLSSMRDDGKSLLYRAYNLHDFRDSDFDQSFLDQLEEDFNNAREAGIKLVPRFRYTTSMDDPDAPLEQLLSHVEQLKPIFHEHYDVIAVLNAGFIGAWGEWHASTNDLTSLSNKREVLAALLDALPEQRAVQLRYPMDKMDIYETHTPVGPDTAFTGADIARTGHHNDCFLASPTDVGTYRFAVQWEKIFLHDDTRYLPMGGETCRLREDAGTRYYCESAIEEMEFLRWSFLNSSYYSGILDTWVDQGCMPEVQRRLGYRFSLIDGRFSNEVRPGSSLDWNLTVENQGFAAPFNPRDLKVVLRNQADADDLWEADLPEDPRYWLGGDTISLSHQLGIPSAMEEGDYDVLLYLPDPTEKLSDRPEYAIRLANEGIWEEISGFNHLDHSITVTGDAPGDEFDGEIAFRVFGTEEDDDTGEPTSALENKDQTPGEVRLNHNYPNPFNPATQISFEIPDAMNVKLEVFNISGQHITTLVNERRSAGHHTITFDAGDLASGIYMYRLTTGDIQLTRSMSLIK